MTGDISRLETVRKGEYGPPRGSCAACALKVLGNIDLDVLDLARDVIDLRSFSSLWYWISLAVMWSALSSWVMGVPHDTITRARRGDEQSAHDMHVVAKAHVNRLLAIVDASSTSSTAIGFFVVTSLGVLGFVYGVELGQAAFLLVFPFTLVGVLSVITARQLRETDFDDLAERLRAFRFKVQSLGMLFIFITALWGMWVNVRASHLWYFNGS